MSRKSSVFVGTTGPRESEVAFGTTERADMDSFGPMGAGSRGTNIEVDANFLVVRCVDVAIDDFGPEAFPIGEFLLGEGVMEEGMSPFGAEDAGSRGREPAPAGLKGPALSFIGTNGGWSVRIGVR